MKHLLKYFLFFIALLAGKISYAQDWNMILEMVVTDEGKNMGGAEVNVYRDGQFVEKVISNAKGRVDVKLKPNGVYTVSIGGSNDYIKKKIEINTNGVPAEAFTADVYFPAEVDIFKKLDGLNYDILNQPIGKIDFQEEVGGFDVDRGYTQQMQSKLADLEKGYLAQKKKEAAEEKKKQKEYDAAIKKADDGFKSEDWETAELEYKKAAAIKPLETYPSFQLAELQSKLIEIRKNNTHYEASIKKADVALAAKDYKKALAEYKLASSYKPNEEYPKTKLEEVQNILTTEAKTDQAYIAAIERGDNALKITELETAKTAFEEATKLKPEESYPKNKLAEIKNELSKKQAKEAEYLAAVKVGDDALASTKYTDAKTAYEKAQGLKPTESYPAEQIEKIEGLMAESAKKDQDYLAALEKGENALKIKSYEDAITAFEEASSIKTMEEYPKNKIKEIKNFMAKNTANEKAYQDNIAAADKALGKKDYENAQTNYQAALKLKPKESYPQEKLTEIETTLAAFAKKEENYRAAIAQGDEALKSKDYATAKTAYNNALGIKSDEQYPKDKITEIEGIQKQLESSQAAYDEAISKGDGALAAKNYEAAKKSYQAATQLKTDEQYPKDKLSEIDKAMAQLAEKENAYSKAIQEGDNAKGTGDIESAKTNYTAALTIKPDATYPKQQIDEINKKLANKEKLEADYQVAVSKADKALEAKNYQEATTAYQDALNIKEDDYPKGKIKEIEGLLAASKEKDVNYQAAIDKADKAFGKKDWENAKTAYQEALSIKKEDYPSTQITAIEVEIAKDKVAKEALAKVEADYQNAISDGDAKLSEDNLEAALTAYQTAANIKPDESYPKGKITDIQAEIKKRADKKAQEEAMAAEEKQYKDLVAKADGEMKNEDFEQARKDYQAALAIKSEEKYPQTKIDEINATLADAKNQETAYQNAIAAGDKLLEKEDWNGAKEKYAAAASIKPNEQYPKDKLKDIDVKLAAIAANAEKIRLEKEKSVAKDEEYQGLIADADNFYKAEKYEDAKTKYQAALAVKSEEYPQTQINKIGEKLAALEKAKANKAEEAEQAEIDAKYQTLVDAADDFFKNEKYEEAKTKYQAALAVKSEEYPQTQINKIGEKLAALEKAKANKAEEAKQAEIDAEYQTLVDAADDLFKNEKYEDAKTKYQAALAVKSEAYPQTQIDKIGEELAALEQSKADDTAAKEKAKKEAQYQVLIAEADALLNDNKLRDAKEKYIDAIGIKEDSYPANKIAEIDKELDQLAAANTAKDKKAELDKQYQDAIKKADKYDADKDYGEALQSYQAALSLKQNEKYPADKIEEVKSLIAQNEINAAKAEAQYQVFIATADKAMDSKDYSKAKSNYNNALALKTKEEYPKNKIKEIDDLLIKQKQNAKEIRIQQEQEAKNEASYQQAIVKADQLLKDKKLKEARNEYQLALGLKSSEKYPQEQTDKIDKLLNEKAAAISSAKDRKAQAAALNDKYKGLIESGDDAFSTKQYHLAKREFQSALDLKPNESYPKEQLKKVEDLLAKKNAEEKSNKQIADKPIKIQKGERATIDSDAEDKIDQMYEEIWAKNKADKSKKIQEKEEAVMEFSDKRREEEFSNRKNAIEKIEDISVSLQKQNKEATEYNLQNYETIKEKEKALKKYHTELEKNNEHQRNEVYAQKEDYAKSQKAYNDQINNDRKGVKEEVEKDYEDRNERISTYAGDQRERMGVGKTNVEQKAADIREYNQQRASEQLNSNQESLKNKTDGLKETEESFQSESKDRRQERQKDIDDMTLSQKQYSEANKESFKEGQNEVENKEKALKEEHSRLEENAKDKREKNADREFYRGEDKPRQDKAAANYPQGVTEKIIEGNNSTTIQRIVVDGTQVDTYEKTLYNYGKTFYTKNGTNITEEVWDKESK